MFDKIIVIGIGTVACKCAKLLSEKNIELSFIESRSDISLSAENFCNKNNIDYLQLGKQELTEHLCDIVKKTLIISVSNRYLFPAIVLDNANITIINYHGALLPKYPGRNAESWAIYNNEKEGGITWHYVVKEVDAGDIITQKAVPIESKTTSFSLLRNYSALAFETFEQIIDSVIEENAVVSAQKASQRQPILYSWQKPNDGELNLDWDENRISVFLRAMDYGPLEVLGKPFFMYEGTKYEFSKYKITPNSAKRSISEIEFTADALVIRTSNFDFTLTDLKII